MEINVIYHSLEDALYYEDVVNREELINKLMLRFSVYISMSDEELLECANRYRSEKGSNDRIALLANDPIDW
jgi:hypothetical protein